MRILMLHNRYQQLGGEDISTRNEAALLRDGGHEVELVEYDNEEVDRIGSLRAAARAIWSAPAVADVSARLRGKDFDVLHVQNYLPLISPAVHHAAKRLGVTTVQALRNYRLTCSGAQLYRDDKPCFTCVGKFAPWDGIRHRCYRNSRAGSATITGMIAVHKMLGTWTRKVDALIAVSDYVRGIYEKAGFPADRLYAKPNVVAAADAPPAPVRARQIAYVGRLSHEKGCDTLIDAWKAAGIDRAELVMVGDGPSMSDLRARAEGTPGILFTGRLPPHRALDVMRASMALVIPSKWGEPFPRTGVEAYACGTPVFGADSGGIGELFHKGQGGALFPAGDTAALARLIARLFADETWARGLRDEATALFQTRFSPPAVLALTEEIYGKARAMTKMRP